jgi:hypothetical protein
VLSRFVSPGQPRWLQRFLDQQRPGRRRDRGTGGLSQRGDGRGWQVCVTFADGRRKSARRKTRAAAEVALAALREERDQEIADTLRALGTQDLSERTVELGAVDGEETTT